MNGESICIEEKGDDIHGVFEARELSLPKPLYAQTPKISSFIYDPVSASMALRHFDSSFSLYFNFSPISNPNFPPPKAVVPCPTSAAAFLHIRTGSSTIADTVFVASSPVLHPSPGTLLCFYLLRGHRFVKVDVVSNHRDLEFDKAKGGVMFKVVHGVSVKLSAGVNVFTLYSVSNAKIWVFAVRLVVDEGGREALKLLKCAVIDCCFPVFTVGILFGILVLGEENGVRIFPLKYLINGNRNATILQGKPKCMKLVQDSRSVRVVFVAFEEKDEEEPSISTKTTRKSVVKAVSVHALSTCHFVVVDSVGDAHILCLSSSEQPSRSPFRMKRLPSTMKVQKTAVYHDATSVTDKLWISDGIHSVHLVKFYAPSDKQEKNEPVETETRISVTHAIFIPEKIREILPLDADGILILGQGIRGGTSEALSGSYFYRFGMRIYASMIRTITNTRQGLMPPPVLYNSVPPGVAFDLSSKSSGGEVRIGMTSPKTSYERLSSTRRRGINGGGFCFVVAALFMFPFILIPKESISAILAVKSQIRTSENVLHSRRRFNV
ncbi:hypothetical protein M569_15117 [Genlisea aurea]|uniref:Cleavage/polyadenylation specificity factor A subunit N-terminal domain-containing protein n=1 Tax=Genlisea aurea TaxID=192259 RepID=S8BZ38_9LAMI|nr:hypothetical protein M569_15117 [Genlisea aurea]